MMRVPKKAADLMKEALERKAASGELASGNETRTVQRLEEHERTYSRILSELERTFNHIRQLLNHISFFPNLSSGSQHASAFQTLYGKLKAKLIRPGEEIPKLISDCKAAIENLIRDLDGAESNIQHHIEDARTASLSLERAGELVKIERSDIEKAENDLPEAYGTEQQIAQRLTLLVTALQQVVIRINRDVLPLLPEMLTYLNQQVRPTVLAYARIMEGVTSSMPLVRVSAKITAQELIEKGKISIGIKSWVITNLPQSFTFERAKVIEVDNKLKDIRRRVDEIEKALKALRPAQAIEETLETRLRKAQ